MLKRISTCVIGIFIVAGTFSTTQAQFAVGGSYEIRNEEPKTGFGVRVEKGISLPIPLIGLGVRASVSNFSEENRVSPQDQSFTYNRDIRSIDYGVTVLGKVKLGLVKPYVGIGIGGTRKNLDVSEIEGGNFSTTDLPSVDENSLNYHGIIGGEFSLIPLLNPFVEYRVNNYTASMDLETNRQQLRESVKESNGRIIFGIMLRF